MALFRKLLMLAVTTGVAKKAWEAYRGTASSSGMGPADRSVARERRRSAQDRRVSKATWGGRPGAD